MSNVAVQLSRFVPPRSIPSETPRSCAVTLRWRWYSTLLIKLRPKAQPGKRKALAGSSSRAKFREMRFAMAAA